MLGTTSVEVTVGVTGDADSEVVTDAGVLASDVLARNVLLTGVLARGELLH